MISKKLFWILVLFSISIVHAHAEDLLARQFCPNDDCGILIIGGAYVIPTATKWNGTSPIAISMFVSGEGFGFIGKTRFLKSINDSWKLTSPHEVSSLNLSSTGPEMGFYFSPTIKGYVNGTITYETPVLPDGEKTKSISGSAITDDITSPAITLTATIAESYATKACQDINNCIEVDVPTNNKVTFRVTPTIDSNRVNQLGATKFNYAQVSLDITESKSNCPPYTPSFHDSGAANYNPDNYFDMIWGLDSMYPTGFQQQCNREHTFLASANKSFDFIATAISDTENNGYAQYLFYIAGHYDESDLSKYANSYQIFRLRSGDFTTPQPTTTKKLTITVKGNGSVSDSTDKTKVCSKEQTCSWIYPVNAPIVLATSSNDGSTLNWSDSTCGYPFQLTVDKTCTATFSPQVVTPTKATLAVNVAKSQGTVWFNGEPSTCNEQSCTKDYTTAQQSITLTPKPVEGYEFSVWGEKDECAKTVDGNGSATLSINLGESKTCTLSFKKSVATVLKACIDPISQINPPINLSSTCSGGDIGSYKWTKMLISQSANEKLTLLSEKPIAVLDKEGNYLIRLELFDRTGQKSVDSKQITVSSLKAVFFSWVNGSQVSLIAIDSGAEYIWFINEDIKETGNKLTKVLPVDINNSITMLISKNAETANISRIVKTVRFVQPISDFSVSFSQGQTPTFVLDASSSCDEDNRDDTGKTACDPNYSPLDPNTNESLDKNSGITKYSWKINGTELPFKEGKASSGSVTCSSQENEKKLECSHTDKEPLSSPVDILISLNVSDDDVDQNGALSSSTSKPVEKTIQLNRPVANFTVTQGVDKIITLRSTSQDSSYSIPGSAQPTSSISSYSWSVNGELQQQCNDNSCTIASLKNGEHNISLIVTDNHGLKSLVSKKTIFVGNPIGFEGKTPEGWSWNADGTQTPQNKSGQSKFFGGVCVSSSIEMCDFSTYTKQVSLAEVSNQTAFFRATLEINDTDLGKNASLLFVFGRDESPFNGTTTDYFVNNATPIDLYAADPTTWMAQLTPYKMIEDQPTIKLAKNQVIFWNAPISALHFSNPPNPNDVLYVFFGYKIEEDGSEKGKIVYAPTPLTLTITP